jgi:hypothetical protein
MPKPQDYLNFYFPIVKPLKEKSNVTLVPYSNLKDKCPELFGLVKGKGAIGYSVSDNETIVYDDYLGKKIYKLDFSIKDIAITPELERGDLLLMRGDLIHQTQDAETYRIAASIRVLSSTHLVNYEKLIKISSHKRMMMFGNQGTYNYMISVFRKLKTNNVSIGHFYSYYYNVKVKIRKSKIIYFFYLLWLKIEQPYRQIEKVEVTDSEML